MIHPTSDVQSKNIGAETRIWQFTVVLPSAIIGNNCNICSHCFIENEVIIEDNVTIKSGVQIWDGIRIEADVFIGPNVSFTNDVMPRSKNPGFKAMTTVIKRGASIGAGTVVLPGIAIGEYAFVGAGSLVSKSVPQFELWYGSPAVHRGYITKKGTTLNMNMQDANGNLYVFKNNDLVLK